MTYAKTLVTYGTKDLFMISISLDDGKNWIECPNGVRVTLANQLIDGEDEEGDLVFNFNKEGISTDLCVVDEKGYDIVGTSIEFYCDIISVLVDGK